jgi:hypothetical protein
MVPRSLGTETGPAETAKPAPLHALTRARSIAYSPLTTRIVGDLDASEFSREGSDGWG